MKSPARPLPRFLFVATAFLCAALLPAQPAGTGTIAGRVVNSIGGAALENARVTVTGTIRTRHRPLSPGDDPAIRRGAPAAPSRTSTRRA